ncbi:MAG: HAD-IIIC family phosphatase [Steroidobacteraceae bacterium]
MKLFFSEDDPDSHRLAVALANNREELSRTLYAAVRDKECASWTVPQRFEQVEEWGRAQLLTAVDLLAAWFRTRDRVYQELFAGWVHSRLAADLAAEGAPSDYKSHIALELAKPRWSATLRSQVSARALEMFGAELDRIAVLLSKPALKRLRILFIGDCIQFEIITALVAPSALAQIGSQPTLLNERVLPVLRNRIRALKADEFDLVFFSPFSHRNLPEYEALLQLKSSFWSTGKMARYVDGLLGDLCATLDVLAEHFRCPIYVHNTAATIQSFGGLSGLAKNLVSLRGRTRARKLINRGIDAYLSRPQMNSRVLLVDENGLRTQHGDWRLSRVYLDSNALHPTRLGVELGRGPYFEAVYTAAFLATRKVVVCDLDNTLWEGVIGEGPVTHYLEKQAMLKELRRRGVLLSINSKNDPNNVHWTAAALQADDFVAPRINWNSKAANMAEIRDELNLKLQDFVFIDDRPDELARMRDAFPEIVALDASQPETWNLLSHWQKSLPPEQAEDRTRLYHERAKREQFVNGSSAGSSPVEDEATALSALELSVRIREAGRSGLKRAAELINRTNQFNLCGSRTSVRELENGNGTLHSIITAEASDKFGSMGVVGVMRVDWKPDRVEIPVFVLSCRAFGFGIEYALLNSLTTLAPGDHLCIGHYQETQFNGPCRQMYRLSGLKWDGKSWIGRIADLQPAPEWLAIKTDLAPRPVGRANVQE